MKTFSQRIFHLCSPILLSSSLLVLRAKKRSPSSRKLKITRKWTNCYPRLSLAKQKIWTWSLCCWFSGTWWETKTSRIPCLKMVCRRSSVRGFSTSIWWSKPRWSSTPWLDNSKPRRKLASKLLSLSFSSRNISFKVCGLTTIQCYSCQALTEMK